MATGLEKVSFHSNHEGGQCQRIFNYYADFTCLPCDFICFPDFTKASLVAQLVKNPPAMWDTWVQSLGQQDTLEKGKATHSSKNT